MFLWLLAAWTIFPGSPLLWSLFVVITIAFPVYLHVTTSLLIHPRGIPWTSHFWSVWGDVRTNTAQVALSVVVSAASGLPDERRDRAHDLPQTDFAQETAGMGHGGRCRKNSAQRSQLRSFGSCGRLSAGACALALDATFKTGGVWQ